jgi:leader peptidase (prepilin peptidase)/N-methyltransferase
MCKIMDVFGQNGRQNLWMFFQAVIAVYLLILSVIDIRWKKVSVRSLINCRMKFDKR